jgi:hypothetical protein
MSESVDFYNLIAAERGMPEGWRWHTLEAAGRHTLVTGAAQATTWTSCPRAWRQTSTWRACEPQGATAGVLHVL